MPLLRPGAANRRSLPPEGARCAGRGQAHSVIGIITPHTSVHRAARRFLEPSQDVLVLERGAIVHRGRSDAMLKDAAALDQFIGLRLTDRVNV